MRFHQSYMQDISGDHKNVHQRIDVLGAVLRLHQCGRSSDAERLQLLLDDLPK